MVSLISKEYESLEEHIFNNEAFVKKGYLCDNTDKNTEMDGKNRYEDVIPYKKNRVRLGQGIGGGEYINASFVVMPG